jgi:hypothetical protein
MSQKIYYKLLTKKHRQMSSWFAPKNIGGIRYRVNKWVKARKGHYKSLYVCKDMEAVKKFLQSDLNNKCELKSNETLYTCHVKGIIHRLAVKYPVGTEFVTQVKLLKRVKV